jgi:hypothetical protein
MAYPAFELANQIRQLRLLLVQLTSSPEESDHRARES